MTRVRLLLTLLLALPTLLSAQESDTPELPDTLPTLAPNELPTTFAELWDGFDPTAEPLDTEILKEWEEDGVILRVVRFRVGIFKGTNAMLAGVYGFPKDLPEGTKLPALLNIHGGGQYADYKAPLTNAKRGYASLTISWAGRISAPGHTVNPDVVKLFWDNKTDDPKYRLTTDWGALDAYHAPSRNGRDAFASVPPGADWTLDPVPSPRNIAWFLCTLGARRSLTFLQQQPEVDPERLGVYGHSMGGKLTVATAAADPRVKAAVPSCGGISDNHNPDPIYHRTAGDVSMLPHITAPTLIQSPANDFHGIICDLPEATALLNKTGDTPWRITCSPHINHRDLADFAVASQLWFDQHLKGTFEWPATPQSDLQLETLSGIPQLTVTPDLADTNTGPARRLLDVRVYYTQQGLRDRKQRDHHINQFWHYAPAVLAEPATPGQPNQPPRWTADLPLASTNHPLWVYANVLYQHDETIAGAGYYYGHYATDRYNLSSLIHLVTTNELQSAAVRPTLQPSTTIEDFTGEWRRQWFRNDHRQPWSLRTHKVFHPLWAAPEGNNVTLAFDIRSSEPNTLVIGLDSHATEIPLTSSPDWQSIALTPADFHDAKGAPKTDWSNLRELRLLPAEHLRGARRTQPKKLGGNWTGPTPAFRNLRWVKRPQ